MSNEVYTFQIDLGWNLISMLSQVDRFDASWAAIERKEKRNLKQLRTIATIRSIGASTRIEGSRMSDNEIDILIKNIDVSRLEDRDSQEVAGYFEVLDLIIEFYNDISISVGDIKNLHNLLMKYSVKDEWHKGNFKQHSNAVQATYANGINQVIFETTEPGLATENAMVNLVNWYEKEASIHPLVKCAVFTYQFLSIHPFQDGNGRLSRLLSTLLLLKNGYNWIQYVSFEHEIEKRKSQYYGVLRSCQAIRPNENISEWVNFYFDALKNIQAVLLQKLQVYDTGDQVLPREKMIANYIQDHPGCKSGAIAKALGLTRIIVIRSLATLIEKKIIEKHGTGSGTHYTIS